MHYKKKNKKQDEGGNGQDDLSESKIGTVWKIVKKYLKMLWEWGGSPIFVLNKHFWPTSGTTAEYSQS